MNANKINSLGAYLSDNFGQSSNRAGVFIVPKDLNRPRVRTVKSGVRNVVSSRESFVGGFLSPNLELVEPRTLYHFLFNQF